MQSLELMALFSAVFSDVLPPLPFSFVVLYFERGFPVFALCRRVQLQQTSEVGMHAICVSFCCWHSVNRLFINERK